MLLHALRAPPQALAMLGLALLSGLQGSRRLLVAELHAMALTAGAEFFVCGVEEGEEEDEDEDVDWGEGEGEGDVLV